MLREMADFDFACSVATSSVVFALQMVDDENLNYALSATNVGQSFVSVA